MNRRLASLLVLTGVLLGATAASFLPSVAGAQTARARMPPPPPVAHPTPAPPPPVFPLPPSYEYTFVKREGPEEDLRELQRLGAEGWQVVSTVVVDGSTKRYVLMRARHTEPTPH
ncbi:hypothetical protein [Corallococcus llansteffanensis]|uniref:DUF4177 domain-containing protein n=1 Tax=Corallococcus llansteffanensis TaxID=2316731 RepID=A0A3A8P580_9BACT|nr:hypothetical protein [Corallococcus llansteffanensis]RKH50590.1 hypothetical protein D7V93_30325 [Corallococcus llansteffanensis]